MWTAPSPGENCQKKKKNHNPNHFLKQTMHPQSSQADSPRACRFKLERAGCKTPMLPFPVCGSVPARGAPDHQARCNLQTPGQNQALLQPAQTTAALSYPCCGTAAKHHPDHPPLSNQWGYPGAHRPGSRRRRLHTLFRVNAGVEIPLFWELDRALQFQS